MRQPDTGDFIKINRMYLTRIMISLLGGVSISNSQVTHSTFFNLSKKSFNIKSSMLDRYRDGGGEKRKTCCSHFLAFLPRAQKVQKFTLVPKN